MTPEDEKWLVEIKKRRESTNVGCATSDEIEFLLKLLEQHETMEILQLKAINGCLGQIDYLQTIIKDAPHSQECNYITRIGFYLDGLLTVYPCDCWKMEIK